MYAIWKYDGFPYYLAGEVTRGPDDRGCVYVKSYQAWFKPLVLVSDKVGKEVKAQVYHLRSAHRAAQARAKAESCAKAREVLPSVVIEAIPKLQAPKEVDA